ncbi:hypothetical protein HU200_040600 [Digitaria exilis]|uniref:Photolyase/cryptochrome alpha/beta domain-containing protein n=1 Tax=Digitaria exilis TaxID=1010633 RepID=A0A835B937_9POAL|nr:hypothetical protein HU200_040600 [Digitaria exilis]
MEAATAATAAMVWFRKGLRVHDNPALDAARRGAVRLYPVFVLDPRYLRPDPAAASPGSARAGVARVRFLLESLGDLDARLRSLGSRLLLLRARDDDVADAVCAALKDDFAMASGIEVFTPVSHTLFDPAEIINKEYSELPPVGDTGEYELLPVPTVEELGYGDLSQEWVAKFEKPKGDPSAFLTPATTVLPPYLKIPWSENEELFVAWRDGQTGYPWIDAIMIQFIHWEKGRDVFERLLIDSDWAINNGNWLWLSCSSFFYQYHRVYSPITFGKKYDPNGNYIRHFIPRLKVIDHEIASKECRKRMGEAYALNRLDADPTKGKPSNFSRRKMSQCEDDASKSPIAKQPKRSSRAE